MVRGVAGVGRFGCSVSCCENCWTLCESWLVEFICSVSIV